MVDLAATGAGADADDHPAGALDRQVADVHGRPVGEPDRDPVARLHAPVDQGAGERVGALVVLTPAQPLVSAQVRDPVAGHRGVGADEGTESAHGDGR